MAKGIPKEPLSNEVQTRQKNETKGNISNYSDENLSFYGSNVSLPDNYPFDYTDGNKSLPSRYNTLSWYDRKTKNKRRSPVARKSSSRSATSTVTRASFAFERIDPGCRLINIYILRILFWDILISGGDVVTDFLRVGLFVLVYSSIMLVI